MSQVSSVMRRGPTQFFHWCPACEQMHPLPDSWKFDGNLETPTFSPSFKQTFYQEIGDQSERPNGEERVCHYIITGGVIQFCSDSWHKRSDFVAIPPIPAGVDSFLIETQD